MGLKKKYKKDAKIVKFVYLCIVLLPFLSTILIQLQQSEIACCQKLKENLI